MVWCYRVTADGVGLSVIELNGSLEECVEVCKSVLKVCKSVLKFVRVC